MQRFYFDFHDADGATIDDEGQELACLDMACVEARRTIGEAARDIMASPNDGKLAVEVRDTSGLLLRVTATFVTETVD